MTRLAALVFLVNTFLPILIVGAIGFAGWQSYRAYVDLLEAPIGAVRAQIAEVRMEVDKVRETVAEARDTVMTEAENVKAGVTAATAPINAVATAVGNVATASLDFEVKKPVIAWRPIRLPGKKRRTFKIGKFEPKFVHVSLVDDAIKLEMPELVRTAFSKISDGFGKLTGFTAPMKRIAATFGELSPKLKPLSLKLDALEATLTRAQAKSAEALRALAPIFETLKWFAYLLGPWLLLSYICWVWLRLRAWRRIMTGAG